MTLKVSVVVPAYNEQENLSPLMEDLLAVRGHSNLPFEVVIVDDNSQDKTAELADKYAAEYDFVEVVHRVRGNNGMGYALIEGTKKAGGDVVVWVMGDRSDDLATIPKFVKKMEDGYDLVFASRNLILSE